MMDRFQRARTHAHIHTHIKLHLKWMFQSVNTSYSLRIKLHVSSKRKALFLSSLFCPLQSSFFRWIPATFNVESTLYRINVPTDDTQNTPQPMGLLWKRGSLSQRALLGNIQPYTKTDKHNLNYFEPTVQANELSHNQTLDNVAFDIGWLSMISKITRIPGEYFLQLFFNFQITSVWRYRMPKM